MSEPVYILKLGLQNVRCFGEHAELDLSDGNGDWRRWTVILGDNGLGKTTLLQALSVLESESLKGKELTYNAPKLVRYANAKKLSFIAANFNNCYINIDFYNYIN